MRTIWEGSGTSKSFLIPHYFLLWLRSSLWHHPTVYPAIGVGCPGQPRPRKAGRWHQDMPLTQTSLHQHYFWGSPQKGNVTATSGPCLFLIPLQTPPPFSLTTPIPTLSPTGYPEKHQSHQCSAPKKGFHGQMSLGKVAHPMLLWKILIAHCHI